MGNFLYPEWKKGQLGYCGNCGRERPLSALKAQADNGKLRCEKCTRIRKWKDVGRERKVN